MACGKGLSRRQEKKGERTGEDVVDFQRERKLTRIYKGKPDYNINKQQGESNDL